MRVLLRSTFNRYSGYGNDGVDIARFLDRSDDVDLHVWPVSIMPGLPDDFVPLLTKSPRRGPGAYDVTIQFMPPFDIRVTAPPKPNIRNLGLPDVIADRHYGWSMWEKDKLTSSDMSGHGIGRRPWKHLTAMYVTTKMNVEAFANYDPDVEYRVQPCGIDGELFPVAKRRTDGPTKFCMIGELHQRKDPFIAIEVFSQLKREKGAAFDAELHLKASNVSLPRELTGAVDGLYVYNEYWEYEKLIQWMHDMTCYLGPSRGEGNLKPPMEFMATGGTAIVTNWSGPTNWLTQDVGYPLNYELVNMDRSDPDSPREARADREHLKELMWHVHTNRIEARDKGVMAADWIRWSSDWRKIMDRFIPQLVE